MAGMTIVKSEMLLPINQNFRAVKYKYFTYIKEGKQSRKDRGEQICAISLLISS